MDPCLIRWDKLRCDMRSGAVEEREKNQGDKRRRERREFYRLVYPPGEAPKVTDADYRVIDLSLKAIRFAVAYEREGSCPSIRIDEAVSATLRFRDSQLLPVEGRILRAYHNRRAGEIEFACLLETEMPPGLIATEQRFLLTKFPHLCAESLSRTSIVMAAASGARSDEPPEDDS